ncbi:hypothetical protein ILUMI_10744 [Ignelater luminosus]|uniref:Cytochrome P450 n=1 Tax=Ignelater luminosus TaxID=2038154 RepID=A0A8K0CZT7_IGNLU|nr:hypothetical protein ILUMI_10744 [Ignelater luminosus]
MSILILALLVTLLLFLLYYHWQRRHLYILASKLSGPLALPIVGNGLTFMCRSEDILKTISDIQRRYPKPIRFWFGPVLTVLFSAPQHIEKILTSSKLAYKHDFYSILQIFIGDGLVSNLESILGTKIDAQLGRNMEYVQATADTYQIGYKRIMRPWLHPDIIYNCTSGKKQQDHVVKVTTTFVKEAIDTARSRIKKRKNAENGQTTAIIDQIGELIEKDRESMTDVDFLYHMYTLYLASEDTMTVITAILCVCLGMYPEYQKKASEEIREVFGETPRDVTYHDITKLQYLDMCVRDVLRLIPIAPFIVRKAIEDFHIDNWTIPKECAIFVSIFDVHRDPEHWDNPNHFHPDHFLPEVVTKRHPYAYVPFSAGPRGCVGKILAFIGLKLIMANILQRFEIEADGKFSDIVLRSDITVRSQSGYRVRLKKRMWR